MPIRARVADDLKTAMLAGDAPRVSTIRMILAKLKDADIAARPKGVTEISEDEIVSALRGMAKSRRESVELYKQGNRADLVAKEEAEIAVIEGYLPAEMDAGQLATIVDEAVLETGAAAPKDMGRVMAALKARHGAALDMARVGPLVKQRLGG